MELAMHHAMLSSIGLPQLKINKGILVPMRLIHNLSTYFKVPITNINVNWVSTI
jgi:hypothetical protein